MNFGSVILQSLLFEIIPEFSLLYNVKTRGVHFIENSVEQLDFGNL